MTTKLSLLIAFCSAFGLTQCTTSSVQTEATQAATTPQQAIAELKAGNARFVAGHGIKRDLNAQQRLTASGQHPIAAVLGCIDSRASNELIFDQGIGDIFSARVAGNVLNSDLVGSMEFATVKAGAKAIVVVGHTRCGAVAGACKDVHLGQLDGLLAKIKPAVSKVAANPKCDHSGPAFEDSVAAENVKLVVHQLRSESALLRKLEQQGKLAIVGALYHLDTGRVEFFEHP